MNLQDVRSANLLQPYGTVCRLHHALLRHTNDSDLRRKKTFFTNWHVQTDLVTVSAPTIRSLTTYRA